MKTGSPFTMVRRSLWGSRRFSGLPSDDHRYLYLYLLTCPHQTSIGCLLLKEDYALADLRLTGANWGAAQYRKALAALETADLILMDAEAGEILITRWWQDNSPNNESWFSGARKQCQAIKSEKLRKAATDSLEACWADFLARRSPGGAGALSQRASPGIPVDEKLRSFGNRLSVR